MRSIRLDTLVRQLIGILQAVGSKGSLMEQVEVLKRKDCGVPNYSRYFLPYPELNDAFRSALASASLP